MTNSTENDKLKDEVFRKIGRNVVNFQKIEAMLKQLILDSSFKGPIRKYKSHLEDKKNYIDRNSMGTLTREYFKILSSKPEDFHDYPEEGEEAWMSVSVSIENKDGSLPKHKNDFSIMVSERNRLIHQMLANFDPNSTDSCQKLIIELDSGRYPPSPRMAGKNLFCHCLGKRLPLARQPIPQPVPDCRGNHRDPLVWPPVLWPEGYI